MTKNKKVKKPLDEDLLGWEAWDRHCKSKFPNQPERLWLAELEARVDGMQARQNSHARMIDATAVAVIDSLKIEESLQRDLSTFWGRLRWLVRG